MASEAHGQASEEEVMETRFAIKFGASGRFVGAMLAGHAPTVWPSQQAALDASAFLVPANIEFEIVPVPVRRVAFVLGDAK